MCKVQPERSQYQIEFETFSNWAMLDQNHNDAGDVSISVSLSSSY